MQRLLGVLWPLKTAAERNLFGGARPETTAFREDCLGIAHIHVLFGHKGIHGEVFC